MAAVFESFTPGDYQTVFVEWFFSNSSNESREVTGRVEEVLLAPADESLGRQQHYGIVIDVLALFNFNQKMGQLLLSYPRDLLGVLPGVAPPPSLPFASAAPPPPANDRPLPPGLPERRESSLLIGRRWLCDTSMGGRRSAWSRMLLRRRNITPPPLPPSPRSPPMLPPMSGEDGVILVSSSSSSSSSS